MASKTITISLTPEYHNLVKEYAKEKGMSVSAWITRRIYLTKKSKEERRNEKRKASHNYSKRVP